MVQLRRVNRVRGRVGERGVARVCGRYGLCAGSVEGHTERVCAGVSGREGVLVGHRVAAHLGGVTIGARKVHSARIAGHNVSMGVVDGEGHGEVGTGGCCAGVGCEVKRGGRSGHNGYHMRGVRNAIGGVCYGDHPVVSRHGPGVEDKGGVSCAVRDRSCDFQRAGSAVGCGVCVRERNGEFNSCQRHICCGVPDSDLYCGGVDVCTHVNRDGGLDYLYLVRAQDRPRGVVVEGGVVYVCDVEVPRAGGVEHHHECVGAVVRGRVKGVVGRENRRGVVAGEIHCAAVVRGRVVVGVVGGHRYVECASYARVSAVWRHLKARCGGGGYCERGCVCQRSVTCVCGRYGLCAGGVEGHTERVCAGVSGREGVLVGHRVAAHLGGVTIGARKVHSAQIIRDHVVICVVDGEGHRCVHSRCHVAGVRCHFQRGRRCWINVPCGRAAYGAVGGVSDCERLEPGSVEGHRKQVRATIHSGVICVIRWQRCGVGVGAGEVDGAVVFGYDVPVLVLCCHSYVYRCSSGGCSRCRGYAQVCQCAVHDCYGGCLVGPVEIGVCGCQIPSIARKRARVKDLGGIARVVGSGCGSTCERSPTTVGCPVGVVEGPVYWHTGDSHVICPVPRENHNGDLVYVCAHVDRRGGCYEYQVVHGGHGERFVVVDGGVCLVGYVEPLGARGVEHHAEHVRAVVSASPACVCVRVAICRVAVNCGTGVAGVENYRAGIVCLYVPVYVVYGHTEVEISARLDSAAGRVHCDVSQRSRVHGERGGVRERSITRVCDRELLVAGCVECDIKGIPACHGDRCGEGRTIRHRTGVRAGDLYVQNRRGVFVSILVVEVHLCKERGSGCGHAAIGHEVYAVNLVWINVPGLVVVEATGGVGDVQVHVPGRIEGHHEDVPALDTGEDVRERVGVHLCGMGVVGGEVQVHCGGGVLVAEIVIVSYGE